MMYGAETWSTTANEEYQLAVIQRKMERRMTSCRIRDRIENGALRERSLVKDIIELIYDNNKRWAGHVARRTDNRWAKRVTEWRPYQNNRPRGRPHTR